MNPPVQGRVSFLFKSIGTAALGLLCASCAGTYRDQSLNAPGAPAPAVVIEKFPWNSDYSIYKVDGAKIGLANRLELMPGNHTLAVSGPGPEVEVNFPAKSGETYNLDAEWKYKPFLSGKWRASITDVATGRKFSSEFVNFAPPPSEIIIIP